MNDSNAPPGKSTPSNPPPPTNLPAIPTPPPPLPGTAAKLPNAPQANAPHPGEQPPPQGGPFRVQDYPAPAAPPSPKTRIPLRSILFAAAGVIATVALILFVVFRPTAPRKARSIGARLDLAAGDVTVNDATGDVKALSGTPLGAGASVSTAKGARALVRTGEGAALFLRGETSLKLLERGVDVASGEVFL
ncbi:MAG: Ca-activated chloride channel, partial [Myxococcales bacterium]|nr:Ca-activated chloride channel [Myxococcales bacterium]